MLVNPSSVLLVLSFVLTLLLCSSIRKDEGRSRPSGLEGKIVGGTPVPIEKFPTVVVLYNAGGMCAATILNSWAVLTAAHCFIYNDDVDKMAVLVGVTRTDDETANVHKVLNISKHPDFGKVLTFSCDIALVFLATPIKFGPKAKKAVLANNADWMSERETQFVVTGWGLTKYDGKASELGLQMAELRFIDRKKCSVYHNADISEDMFCLYGDAKRDSCKGDSGGGVLWNGQMVGIVSHGDRCAQKNKPSIYCNVWYFRSWIEKTMKRYIETNCE